MLVIAGSAFWPAAAAQQPVVVELFTSEGCSDCPPADALLTELRGQPAAGNAELILLEEHVDYWNSSGWVDRFSSSDFTGRQNSYVKQFHLATAYTPQMVVDGRLQGVGNDPAAVRHMISEASADPKSSAVALRFVAPGKLAVMVVDASHGQQRALLAITEDDLTTNVRGGENGGRTLKHTAVVRSLKSLGTTASGNFETTVDLPAKSDWKQPSLRAIVLVQNPISGQIVGAASIPYPDGSPVGSNR